MRVALLTHNAPAGDAIGNQTAEKVAFFLDRGADVRVFLESDRHLPPGLRACTCVLPDGQPTAEAWQFLTTADSVLAEYGHFYPLLQILPLLAGGRPRILFDYHGVTPPGLWAGERREIAEAAARWRGLVWCADEALAHSQFARQELLDATAFPVERIGCLGYVIDGSRFHPGRPARPLWEGQGSAAVLLYAGRLAPNKRVPVLVEALAQLLDLTPPVHAVLVGDCTDVYKAELRHCQERASALSVADRLHCLGHVADDRLLDAYRAADVLVLPSRHEAFGIPVLEAMACGVPVIAARAAALPETVAGAGLTFTPDDPEDLAQQIRRVLAKQGREASGLRDLSLERPARTLHVAVVSFRYGTDFVGGAETSLRIIAESLHQAGHAVEVFTTCTCSVSAWTNDLPEGTTSVFGVPVHRFHVDPWDQVRHLETVCAVREAEGQVPAAIGHAYFAHSIQSARLLDALGRRIDEFDAVVVGPYLLGLTHAVARAFPDRTVLLPCFHDEGFARLAATREAYEQVAGILYHSPEEQELAQRQLGINHPNATCAGTFVDTANPGDAATAAPLVAGIGRYVVYCGRYSDHKGVPRLIEFARRYHERSPERFTFVFLGEGEVAIPAEPWARDLGFVEETSKRSVLAGAAALVQLSRQESLSLAALEAWAQGTPVVADIACPVLAGQLRRSGGGQVVDDFESFAAALDSLWSNPEHWQALGRQGRDYVVSEYGSRAGLAARVARAIIDIKISLNELMRRRGLERAAAFSRNAWRGQLGTLVDDLLHAEARPYREQVEVRPRLPARHVPMGIRTVLIPVRVANRGTHTLVPEGPARTVLRCRVEEYNEEAAALVGEGTPLPGLLLPGRSLAAALPVPVPEAPGNFAVVFWAQRAGEPMPAVIPGPSLRLVVEHASVRASASCCAPLLDLAEAALVEAQRLQRLPDTYLDVTLGWLARWKRWLKRKLLGNFKHAYVDVLSRQQSAVNTQVVTALRELTECCATLDHAVRQLQEQLPRRPLLTAEATENAEKKNEIVVGTETAEN